MTLIDMVAWLAENPASGWRIRQLPIRRIDTKWLERHRSVVETLHSAITGRTSGAGATALAMPETKPAAET